MQRAPKRLILTSGTITFHGVSFLAGAAVYLIWFWPALAGSATLYRGYDASVQSYPWLVKLMHGWSVLQPPLWDFSVYSGTTFVGELQTGVFYPVNVLLAAFSLVSDTRWLLEFYIYAHYVLAFYLMCLLMRHLKVSLPAALLAGYAFASYLDWAQPNRLCGLVYLPLILLLFDRGRDRPGVLKNPWLYLCGAVLAMMLLAGHNQPYVLGVIVLSAYSILVRPIRASTSPVLLKLLMVGAVSIGFSAPQILLTLEYLSRAYRWAPERIPALGRVPYEWYGFLSTLHPELFKYLALGWIPLAIALGFAVWFLEPSRRRWALLGLTLLVGSLLVSFGDRALVARLAWHVPLVNTVRETERFIDLTLFASALLLGLGFDLLTMRLLPRLTKSMRRPARATAAVAAGVAMAALLWLHSAAFLRPQSADDPLTPSRAFHASAIVGRVEAESGVQGSVYRVFNLGGCLPQNIGDVYDLQTILGHRATMDRFYYDFVSPALGNPHSERLDQLGARFLVSCEPVEGFPLLAESEGVFLYERPAALPVFRFRAGNQDGSRTAVLSDVEWYQNSVILHLAENPGGSLVFAMPSYPGWSVSTDRGSRSLDDSDTFLKVRLDGSESTVAFRYRPVLLYPSLLLVLIAGAGMVVACLSRPGPSESGTVPETASGESPHV